MLQTFAGAVVDRISDRRTDDAWVAERVRDPASRAVVAGRRGVLLDADDGSRLARVPMDPEAVEPVLLGIEDGGALFAIEAADDAELTDLRTAAAGLAQDEGGLAAYASALRNWHRSHQHCARCGTRTAPEQAGHIRACPNCGAHHYPRTDPVVIMLVEDGDDRVLLGRQPSWPANRWSALAGFVEQGESLEEAVAREVREEAGVEVTDVRYLASQPWPFPAQLMLGFIARHASGEARAVDEEMEEVRWFTRAELEDAVAERGEVGVPPRLAIARHLIEHWLGTPPR